MKDLPVLISLGFTLLTLLTVFIFYKATTQSKIFLAIALSWLLLQAVISFTGFFTVTNTLPPRQALLLMPPLIGMVILFVTRSGKQFMDGLDIKVLTLLHLVRVPVELFLLWLFRHSYLPEVMTFEGWNFDMLSGLSVARIYYAAFKKKGINRNLLIAWNCICLALLLNIVIIAVLSIPSPFQQLGFGQPNIAVLYFPFAWLPSVIVPLVLFSHLVALRQLILTKTTEVNDGR